jgi:hypothetical protein
MSTSRRTRRLHATFVCCFAAAAGLACAALVGAAALVPAPPVVLPLICAICACYPRAFGDEVRASISVLRDPGPGRLRRRDLVRMRRELERLPETEHPLEP